MHTELILTLLTLSALATYAVVLYNSLVALKHNVAQAWSNIDVLLKQRHDELPKLVTLARQYMAFEQETLDRVIHARAAVFSACENGDVSKVGAAEHLLQQGMGKFFAVAEQYPALKADENFRHLRERVTGLENTIADRREFYNESANLNNIRIEQFPEILIARLFDFTPRALLELSTEETRDVDLKSLFT